MSAIVNAASEVNNLDFSDLAHEATDNETGAFLMDEGPHKTVWMVHDRQFDDGQREICVTKSTRIRQNGPLPLINRAKRGESEKREENKQDSVKRAKQQVRLRCKQIRADRMITLTLRENVQDVEIMAGYFDKFRRSMSKAKKFHYVATIEPQERGALHMHIAVKGVQHFATIRGIWQKVVGQDKEGREMGQINVRNPNSFGFGKSGLHKLASYIAKYIGKNADIHALNKKKYWSSKGIVLPEKNYYQLPYGTSEADAYLHILQIAANHNNDGMTFFSNSGLGVCWVATGPTIAAVPMG